MNIYPYSFYTFLTHGSFNKIDIQCISIRSPLLYHTFMISNHVHVIVLYMYFELPFKLNDNVLIIYLKKNGGEYMPSEKVQLRKMNVASLSSLFCSNI